MEDGLEDAAAVSVRLCLRLGLLFIVIFVFEGAFI